MGVGWPDVWQAAVLTLVGLVVVGLWRGGGKLLAALVEIARLPAVVESLSERFDRFAGLVERVERLEGRVEITTENGETTHAEVTVR